MNTNNALSFFSDFTADDIKNYWGQTPEAERYRCYDRWLEPYLLFSFTRHQNLILPREWEDYHHASIHASLAVAMLIRMAEEKPVPELGKLIKTADWPEINGAIQDYVMECSEDAFERQRLVCPALGDIRFLYYLARDQEGKKSENVMVLDYLQKILWILMIIAESRSVMSEN